ncbi:hypothetical protein [Geobacter sp. DSM 9736]|uniref:hypothetical protein n=1 Tax=Geobacter sp. DSM 9736 TaxID=1277350 RepID=UPI000B508632|nr:hypothetical protein [Geobacter sp. DSM 9736]SNB46955.1 hypothetical protein SAMN06269301_2429 [Geobacter sp. DSM 9736]
MKVCTFLMLGLWLLYSASVAVAKGDYESLMIKGEIEAAKNELRTLYKAHEITSDELNPILDFMAIGVLQSMAKFDTLCEKYLTTRDKEIYVEAKNELSKINKIIKGNKRIIQNGKKFLSKDFIVAFNDKISTANQKLSEATEIYRAEVQREKEERQKLEIENKLKKEKLERLAELERLRQQKAEKAYREANDWAEQNPEYLKPELSCEVCQAMVDKKENEEAIKKEKQYSAKYGVVNLSRIEDLKINIIRCDDIIKEKTSEYKKLTGVRFNFSMCKQFHGNCDETLEKTKNKLVEKYLAEHQSEASNASVDTEPPK